MWEGVQRKAVERKVREQRGGGGKGLGDAEIREAIRVTRERLEVLEKAVGGERGEWEKEGEKSEV